MTLQSSGAISILNIVGEFGGSGSHSLSEYYKGGTWVPSTTIGGSIPTGSAGTQISLSNFYGATTYTPPAEFNRTVNVVTYSGNWNVRDYLINAGWDGSVKVNLTLSSTTMIVGYSTTSPHNGSPGTARPAMIINGSFPNGLKIINNGKILGRGARGASATPGVSFHNNYNGWPGGDAISNSLSTSTLEFVNNGYVAGGGGGGAAAAYAGGGAGAGGAPGGSGRGANATGQPGGTNGTGTNAGAGGGSPSGTSTPAVETGTPSNAFNWGGSDGGSGDRGGHGGTAGGGGATAIDTGSSNGIWGGGGGGSGFVLPGTGGNGGDRSGSYRSAGREGGDGGSGGNQGGTGISTYGGEDGGGGGGGWGAKGGDSPSGTGGAGGKAVTGTAINFTGTGTEYGANG